MLSGVFAYLREFNLLSITLRLVLPMLFGGMIGLERGRKRRAAGFRTYMLVCLGASLSMILGQYHHRLLTVLSGDARLLSEGIRMDISRIGAQVISGIGFLGAGTIIVTGYQQVKGLTTAAGLWASACMGLAIGAGFYECVVLGVVLIFFCIRVLPTVESLIIEHSRNMNLYIEFRDIEDIGKIIECIKQQDVQIYDVEIDHGKESGARNPSAVFAVRTEKRVPHERILSAISEIENVTVIEEIQ